MTFFKLTPVQVAVPIPPSAHGALIISVTFSGVLVNLLDASSATALNGDQVRLTGKQVFVPQVGPT